MLFMVVSLLVQRFTKVHTVALAVTELSRRIQLSKETFPRFACFSELTFESTEWREKDSERGLAFKVSINS